MDSVSLRKSFLEFFKSKKHHIVPSAPLVLKNDPTLMFVNAGMNQFKDIFLGYAEKTHSRIADTQKCLRVSGKHNDLDEVGHDTYHHTLFEMLGNWSFGDYYKKEAISWAWEYLTDVLKIDKDRLYATVFEGDKSDNLTKDEEAYSYWKEFLPEERILNGNKKDNFWEMGAQGPCGPCSEIHVDIRSDEERAKIPGRELINKDHPQVIEIWNLVFIQYNRKADGSLENLPERHIDTGMGFERLAMVTQGKQSNYDTDIFQGIIQELSNICEIKYGTNEKTDIALRVVADHLRAVSFSIADGQLPSNNGAGYVIRRILRRAVRYGYTFLNMKEPFIYKLLPALQANMGEAFPELIKQSELISKVLKEEEASFFRTLETGMSLIEKIMEKSENKTINGADAFELYDTYGFPLDLTELIARENGFTVDKEGFDKALAEQKQRSKKDAQVETDDWVEISNGAPEFVGYDTLEAESKIIKYRKVKKKGKNIYQIVLDKTPFYAESGGQVGDKGYLLSADGKKISIIDTVKENNLSVCLAKELPEDINGSFKAVVDAEARQNSANNHTATHLLHFALRKILGTHVEQKGSLVTPDYLRFDFSHFQKLSNEELKAVEQEVNKMIRANFPLIEKRETSMQEAQEMGAMALFGEKYGDKVRVIKFGESVELCGGTHVKATGDIGCFKITQETSVASGIRRIEAISAKKAEDFINKKLDELSEIAKLFKGSKNLPDTVAKLIDDNNLLQKKLNDFAKEKAKQVKAGLKNSAELVNDEINLIASKVDLDSADLLKDLSFQLKGEMDNLVLILGAEINNKPLLSIMISDNLLEKYNFDAGKIIREAAKEIKGGGGGQKFYATAGGKDINGIDKAINKAKELITA